MKQILIAILFCGLPLLAQPPRGFFAWWDSPVVRDLNLSEDQQKQIKSAVRDFRPKLIDLRANAEKAEAAMEDAFNDEPFDQRRATEAVDRMVAARGELTRALSVMGVRLRATLTPEQWKELAKRREGMRDNMREMMRDRRPMDGKGPMRMPRGNQPPPQPQED